jgi:4-nitrophenyl phosphatase
MGNSTGGAEAADTAPGRRAVRDATTVVCDLDGVLYTGRQPIAGAGEALARIAASGRRLVFATNNSTRTPAQVAETIERRTGFAAPVEDIVTSALAAADHLRGAVTSAYVIGGEGLHDALQAAGIEVDGIGSDVAAVVVGLDRAITYEKLEVATLAVRAGARLIASNGDPTFPSPRGLVPGAGSIVAALEASTGRAAEVCGKPHEPMARLVKARAARGGILMVGDRITTDIAFGLANGWSTVLVLSGVTGRDESAGCAADQVIESFADLPAILVGAG